MIFHNEKQLLKIIKYTPSIFILLISIIILSFQFIENKKTFEKEKEKIHSKFIKENKIIIKEKVNEVYNYIKREQNSTEDELKKSLKHALVNAHVIAKTIYENNKNQNPKLIKKLIIDALRNIRFNKGRGYYFIYENSGKNILLPHNEELEGKDFWSHQDAKGSYIIQDMTKLLKQKDQSFYEWYWFNPINPDKQRKKIGLVRNFEPFNWFIGTGEYIEDFEKEVQEGLLRNIKEIRFNNTGYIFIINYDSIYLSHIRKNYIGKSAIINNDATETKKVIKDLVSISKKGEGYYSYIQNKKPGSDESIKKISYVKGLNDWSWIIGAGFYEDDIKKAIIKKKIELKKEFEDYLIQTIQISLILIIILLAFSIYFSRILQRKFVRYNNEINEHLTENTRQQNIMAQQSKMAAMGEMIGNIAHQWRQPLSTITTTATGIKLQKELGMLKDDFLVEGLTGINDSAQYLSKTIDDFRNFFKTNKKTTNFSVSEAIDKSLSICSAQLYNLEIEIIKDIKDTNISNYENEFIQVIINIISNAKDELLKKNKYFKKMIFIKVKKENDFLTIKIKDNAGGIANDIIDRVFEPYFTTKHQSQGTGIGLYMCREIIEKNMHGILEVKNSEYEYDHVDFKGACFKIKLPSY
ncbi:MAG: histidine kinase [Arcobacter sp.]|nr:MAG: histidine kinase [Arcobacter sp.]